MPHAFCARFTVRPKMTPPPFERYEMPDGTFKKTNAMTLAERRELAERMRRQGQAMCDEARLLKLQHEATQQQLAAAKQGVDNAVVATLRAAGECIALRMVASQERAYTARRNLTTLANLLRIGGARFTHTAATVQALHDVPADMRPDSPIERNKLLSAWRAITTALQNDADAALPLNGDLK